MRRRNQRFWEGPGLLLAFVTVLVVGVGLVALIANGPQFLAGLALTAIGVAIFAARKGFGEAASGLAQHGYIWPRDPERMKPNAELEGSIASVQMAVIGILVAGLGVIWAIAAIVESTA